MCFYNECEWYASVVDKKTAPATKPTSCDECERVILGGEPLYHVYMQEHEACQECDPDMDGCKCDCETPCYGQTFSYDCCSECRAFLEAVEVAEDEAGCELDESRPSLCGMREEIRGSGPDEAKKYFKTALRLHPELKASGYLGRLWKRMF